jgi:hypothetical protein
LFANLIGIFVGTLNRIFHDCGLVRSHRVAAAICGEKFIASQFFPCPKFTFPCPILKMIRFPQSNVGRHVSHSHFLNFRIWYSEYVTFSYSSRKSFIIKLVSINGIYEVHSDIQAHRYHTHVTAFHQPHIPFPILCTTITVGAEFI